MQSFWRIIRFIILFLAFLELFFWIGSWITQTTQVYGNSLLARKKDVYHIMCIGESLTLVGERNSYPSQLEAILNKAVGSRRYQVINQGVGGATTSRIVCDLPQWLQTYHPDMVIAMIGVLDPLDEGKVDIEQRVPFLIREMKLYQLFKQLREKTVAGFNQYVERQKKQFINVSNKNTPMLSEFEIFQELMNQQSEEQKKLYLYIILAEGSRRFDIEQILYEHFLKNNKNEVIHHWMIKKYGNLLIQMGNYEKFVSLMDQIPYNSWWYGWVKGYCHGEGHTDRVGQIIERMVAQGESPLVYGWASSCYEEGGRKDLADLYLKKMESATSSYYTPTTRKNYLAIKSMIMSRNIQPVFVQYPMRNIAPLLSIFENDLDKEKIIFVDNGPSFQQAVREKSYEHYFIDRMSGDVGHATPEGDRLLASNVADAILAKVGK